MSTTPPPPPPPNDPFPGPGSDPFVNNANESLDTGAPAVSASPGRVFAVIAVVGAVLMFLFYNIFFGGGDDDEAPPTERQVAAAPLEPPPLPEPEPEMTAPPPIVPPPVPEPTQVQIIQPEDDSAAQAQAQARLRSGMMIADGGAGLGGLLGDEEPAEEVNDANSQFEANLVRSNTKADKVKATFIGDLRRTIAQGRIIQATLETAINTDLPAPIRAIVSRDVYGEAGVAPLIPAGSRLIGRYNTNLTGGQSRVFVVWTRVIRPDGVDVMIGSPGIDKIGQAGAAGQVDTKFQQMFARAFVASIVTIGTAIASDEITGGGETSTTSSTFGTTQSGEGATTATVNALNRLGSTTDSFLQRFLDLRPTILVDQGTPVNVFVNRDLIFPAELVGTRMVN